MNKCEIIEDLLALRDDKYRKFQSSLVPGVDSLIGVRLPNIRNVAKKYFGSEYGGAFIDELPHRFYEEYMVHAFMIGLMRGDRGEISQRIDKLLPYVDNWAVCDSFASALKYFYKDRALGLDYVKEKIKDSKDFSVRFALVSLLDYYIDEEYVGIALNLACSVRTDEYYVKMAQAWLVSVALAKQYEKSLWILENKLLDPWVHNKAIQKSKESLRISKERKEYLDSLRIRCIIK